MNPQQQQQQQQSEVEEQGESVPVVAAALLEVPASLAAHWHVHRAAIVSQPELAFSLMNIFAPDQLFSQQQQDPSLAVENLDFRRLVKIVLDAAAVSITPAASRAVATRFFGGNVSALQAMTQELLFGASISDSNSGGYSLLLGAVMQLWREFLQRQRDARKAAGGSAPHFESRRQAAQQQDEQQRQHVFVDGREPRVFLAGAVSFRFILEVSGHFTQNAPSPRFLLSSNRAVAENLVRLISGRLSRGGGAVDRFVRVDAKHCLLILLLLEAEEEAAEADSGTHVTWLAHSCVQVKLSLAGAQQQQKSSLSLKSQRLTHQNFVFSSIPLTASSSSRALSPPLLLALSSPLAISLMMHALGATFTSSSLLQSSTLEDEDDNDDLLLHPLSVTAASWIVCVMLELQRQQPHPSVAAALEVDDDAVRSCCEQVANGAVDFIGELKSACAHLGSADGAWKRWQQLFDAQLERANDPLKSALLLFEELLLVWIVLTVPMSFGSDETAAAPLEEEQQSVPAIVQSWVAQHQRDNDRSSFSIAAKEAIADFLEFVAASLSVELDEASAAWLNTLLL